MAFEKIKEKIIGYGDYDKGSAKKSKLSKILLGIKIVVMLVILISFIIYDSNNPVVSSSYKLEIPFKLPLIYIDVDNTKGGREVIWEECDYFEISKGFYGSWNSLPCSDIYEFDNTNDAFAVLTPIADVSFQRFGINLGVPCPTTTTAYGFVSVVLIDQEITEVSGYANELPISCKALNQFSVQREIYNSADGTTDNEFTADLAGTLVTASGSGYVYLMFSASVLTVTEETGLGLFKRIVTDAGGLLAIVSVTLFLIEFVVVRCMFDEAQLYYHHSLRETVLWLADPAQKRTKSSPGSVELH